MSSIGFGLLSTIGIYGLLVSLPLGYATFPLVWWTKYMGGKESAVSLALLWESAFFFPGLASLLFEKAFRENKRAEWFLSFVPIVCAFFAMGSLLYLGILASINDFGFSSALLCPLPLLALVCFGVVAYKKKTTIPMFLWKWVPVLSIFLMGVCLILLGTLGFLLGTDDLNASFYPLFFPLATLMAFLAPGVCLRCFFSPGQN